jgi:alpha-D-ribose 1-methylphosphonate 5-triphosphate synthase subunit PhnH
MDYATVTRDHRTFRLILRAMSRPGEVQRLPEFIGDENVVVELLRPLVDNATTVAVLGDSRLAEELALGCRCPLAAVAEADFVVVAPGADTTPLDRCKRGDLLYPDGGATLLYLVDDLEQDEAGTLLSGPGIAGAIRLRISGLGEGELTRLSRLNGEFPLGVDAMFVARRNSAQLACIPRSTRIGGP